MRLNFRCFCGLMLAVWLVSSNGMAQTAQRGEVDELRQMVRELSARVAVLEAAERRRQGTPEAVVADGEASPGVTGASSSAADSATRFTLSSANESQPVEETKAPAAQPAPSTVAAPQPVKTVVPTQLPGGATLNYFFDGYYGYDFNHPLGRVQYLRAYDVLSNAFSINQVGIVLALDPDVNEGRRYGVRLDLQFGQATDTLQGNAANEPRPEIYRNIFQAYGTYVFPFGKGLTVDVGKWSAQLASRGTIRRTR